MLDDVLNNHREVSLCAAIRHIIGKFGGRKMQSNRFMEMLISLLSMIYYRHGHWVDNVDAVTPVKGPWTTF